MTRPLKIDRHPNLENEQTDTKDGTDSTFIENHINSTSLPQPVILKHICIKHTLH